MKLSILLFCAHGAGAFVPSSKGFASLNVFKQTAVCHPTAPYKSLSALRASTKTADASPAIHAVEDRLVKLQRSLGNFESSGANDLLTELSAMRQSGTDQETLEAFLDDLLARGPDRDNLPFWTRFRPLARFSKRARWASLRRTLDLTTPPPSPEDEGALADDPINQLRRRRRALVSLLRTLAAPVNSSSDGGMDSSYSHGDRSVGPPAIAYIEQKARQESPSRGLLSRWFKRAALMQDLTERRPANLETPSYSVVARRPSYEIRSYEPFSICSVSMTKPRPTNASITTDVTISDPQLSGVRSFGALAGYLFGKNQQETAMAMTTPVLTKDQGEDKIMSFVLPSKFWKGSLDQAPQPLAGSGVMLERMNGGERAVVMFGGYASKKEVSRRKKELIDALAKDKEWRAVENEQVSLAQYNDPFTPPWKRLNEVAVPVQSR